MSAATENIEHFARTRRSGFRYLFTARHHGGDTTAAMWLPSLDRDTEFSIFDLADLHDIFDDRGWLYGVLPSDDGDLRDIGTWNEQVAEFQPGTPDGDPWHGYPKWPVAEIGPPNRRKPKCRPTREVFDRMVAAGMINRIQRKQLLNGRHA
jgi:hypothetical protein